MRTYTVLVSSAGRRVGLIDCFRADAQALGLGLRVIALDAAPDLSAACARADVAFRVPRCGTPEFIPFVEDLVRREGVDLIVPTIDTELMAYANASEQFAALGAVVNVSSPRTVEICRDKCATAELLHSAGIPAPRTRLLSAFRREKQDWERPLILKPIDGSSSIGVRRVRSERDLECAEPERYIVQEFCQGTEFTVNVFFDASGRLRCAIPHRRLEVRAGEVSKGVTERHPELGRIAALLSQALPPCRGAMCFQAIVSPEGLPAVFEINARFGGGYPLAHAAGAAFSRWLLEELAGRQCSADDNWRENVLMLRYDAACFRHPAT